MRTFVIGDIHGQHQALVGCLKASAFDYQRDRLIVLGDVCDRGPRVKESFDELLRISDLVYIVGNHDEMALEWTKHGGWNPNWLSEGGRLTCLSYGEARMPPQHIRLIEKGNLYFEDNGRLFVHAGIDPAVPIDRQSAELLVWDRRLVESARQAVNAGEEWSVPGYGEVFVGHTPTILWGSVEPLHFGNLWMLDTGAGYKQRLTILDVETKEFWQTACDE